MIKCKLCGNEYDALGIHLRRTHKISVEDYLNQFPGSPTMSEESREAYVSSAVKRFEESNGVDSFLKAQREYAQSEANRQRLIAQNKDPRFIESQRERLSKLATATNKRMWQEDYENCRERATKNAL